MLNKDALEMIQDLINQVGDSARQTIVSGLNIESKGSNSYRCPNTWEHKNGDKNPSMGWVANGNYFKCQGCGETINIYSYYKNYLNYTFSEIMQQNGIITIEENVKVFKQNVSKRTKLNDEAKRYIEGRKLTLETAKHFKLVSFLEGVGIPYFKKGVLVGIKKRLLRDGKIKNISATGSKFFLFNIDGVNKDEPLYITEGEWDAMILWQSGVTNVVSVGCGANSTKQLFENAREILELFPQIILFTDNDSNGSAMDKAFVDTFGQMVAIVDKGLYKGLKDANDVYKQYGANEIKKIALSGKARFDGEWDLEENPYEKLDPTGIKFIKTGIDRIDYCINTIQSKNVTLIVGRSNSGKSTFVNQIISSAIDQEHKVYLALGEGNKDKIINKFYTSLIGGEKKHFEFKTFGLRDIKEPKPQVLNAIKKWHSKKLKLWVKSMTSNMTDKAMFDMLDYKIRTEKYDLVVLDNQMSLLTVSLNDNKNEAQAQFVQRCHDLAVATNCAVVLILHPNKTYRKGESLDFEQIAGTSDIANKADVILNVIRQEEPDEETGATAKIQIAKNRDYPELDTVHCAFDVETFTYAEIVNGKANVKSCAGWKKWLQHDLRINDGQELSRKYQEVKDDK